MLTLEAQQPASYRLSVESPQTNTGPTGNAVNDIVVSGDTIWVGSHRGLDRTHSSGTSWFHFGEPDGIKEHGVTAIAIRGDFICVAESISERRENETITSGSGLYVSTDRGQSWNFVEQSREPAGSTIDTLLYGANKIPTLAITTAVNNLSYDIALTTGTIWTANFAGMLRKSTDNGATWLRVILPPDQLNNIQPTDVLNFHLSPSSGALGLQESLNHRVFAVYASSDSIIWVGTAGGINKSTDGGISWQKFSHQNQAQSISGNFVVAINEQRWNGKNIIWAATINAVDQDEKRGVSYSEDGGATWKTTLIGEFAHNISFKDSLVYVTTDNGLFRSSDLGKSWMRSGTIYDPFTYQRIASPVFYAVAVQGDAVWVGGVDGIASTFDTPTQPFGAQWKIYRAEEQVGNKATTYSYPSPFSPDDESVRIHYTTHGKTAPVTIRIFNYSMQPVKTLLQQTIRPGTQEHDEVWDGRDDSHRRIANGVYFYTVVVEGLETVWGKIYIVE